MDYDRNDALLHWLFRQTQGDAWFRPNEQSISSGVALRVSDATASPEFRVFPYENPSLEPFETAVSALNPLVAVKVRNAAVHAALAEVAVEDKFIYVDANTRIQILDTMLLLPQADREQCAAFIRDERVLILWSDSLEQIVPLCHDVEERLIKLLWRSRPSGLSGSLPGTASRTGSIAHNSSAPGSVGGHSSEGGLVVARKGQFGELGREESEELSIGEKAPHMDSAAPVKKRRWLLPWKDSPKQREKVHMDVELGGSGEESRRTKLYAPLYDGLAIGLSVFFLGSGVKTLLMEWRLDGDFIRFSLLALAPFLFCVSLFFSLQIVQNISMAIGPIAHFHENSTYYSAVKPRADKEVDERLPHVTIQMPVYKESLNGVLSPSIQSLKRAMQTYARQGGTSTIFICDDGLRLLPAPDRDERLAYYARHNIGWVARPGHENSVGGFKRAGRFKKASNMNYGLALSLKAEKHLERLLASSTFTSSTMEASAAAAGRNSLSASGQAKEKSGPTQYGMQYQHRDGDESVVWGGSNNANPNNSVSSSESPDSSTSTNNNQTSPAQVASTPYTVDADDLEERALGLAIEEVWEESGKKWRPWAANGRAIRVGEIVLLVDSDTVVPEDCLRDAAREMRACPTVGVLQHESDVMQVAHHYFENGIAYFTRRINRCISISCANGEVAPFVGHNAFLRWKAIQDAKFIDPADGKEKIWSESNVSEDFDMALRLMLKGYIIRWATYSKGGFKEGVSLSVDDELNRWQKYAYGCNELLFNPLVKWVRKGPIAHQIHRFLWSNAPTHYKISMLSYMFSYYGIAAGMTISIINYVLLGFQLPVDGYFIHSFEIWLATVVVFWCSGTVGYTLLEYRLGKKGLLAALWENIIWIPFFFFFFGGLPIPLSQAILAHLFSYNIQWSATVKEVHRSNFFKEIPKIIRRFWFPLLISIAVIAGIIICSTSLVPVEWRVDGSGWAVIFPLALSAGCHILFPIVLNPWLMVFSY